MRKLFAVLFAGVVLTSCTFYDVEPRIDDRDRIVGYYDVEEYSDTYDDFTFYTIRISKSAYAGEIYLNNFYGAGLRVYAVVHYDHITIPNQLVDGYEIEGSGTFYRSELSLSYSVKDLYNYGPTDFCETQAWYDY